MDIEYKHWIWIVDMDTNTYNNPYKEITHIECLAQILGKLQIGVGGKMTWWQGGR